MNKRITIGIPAFNEAKSIGQLLRALVKQEMTLGDITTIVVFSDGSNDETVERARRIKDKRIRIVEGKDRQGKASVENKIFNSVTDDVLVILDADVVVKDIYFIEKLIKPIVVGKADLTSASVEELAPATLVQQALNVSMKFKKDVFHQYKSGNNIYTCHGRARAFSRKLYETIEFENIASEDAFSYLYAISHGFKYRYASDAFVYYTLPRTLSDHKKQSVRFFKSQGELKKFFDASLVESEYRLPTRQVIVSALKYAIKMPFSFILYICVLIIMKIQSFAGPAVPGTWEVSVSTK